MYLAARVLPRMSLWMAFSNVQQPLNGIYYLHNG